MANCRIHIQWNPALTPPRFVDTYTYTSTHTYTYIICLRQNRGRSILSDHAHLSYVCQVTIYKVEPLNKNIAVSLLGKQY